MEYFQNLPKCEKPIHGFNEISILAKLFLSEPCHDKCSV